MSVVFSVCKTHNNSWRDVDPPSTRIATPYQTFGTAKRPKMVFFKTKDNSLNFYFFQKISIQKFTRKT